MSLIYESDLAGLETFIKRGVLDNPNLRQLAFEMSLKIPARDGDINEAIVKRLLQHKADVNMIGANDRTPLMCADNIRIIDLLVEHGVDLNQRNSRGQTALMLNARESSDFSDLLVFKLIKCGADFTIADDTGKVSCLDL